MRVPILVQLSVPLAVVFATMAALGAWLAGASADRAALARTELHVAVVVETLRAADYPLTPAVLAQVKGFSGLDLVVVESGQPIAGTIAATSKDIVDTLANIESQQILKLNTSVKVNGKPYQCALVELPAKSGRMASKLAILVPNSALERSIATSGFPPFGYFLVGDAIALAIVVWFARRFAKRVSTVRSKAAEIATGVHPRFPAPHPTDELGDLAVTMNDLADRLEAYRKNLAQLERMRLLHQLAGGLAHRLRNGVAGAKLALQLHLRETGTALSESEPIETALRQLNLVEQHVQLLLQTDAAPMVRTPVDMASVARTAVALVEPKARHLQTELLLKIAPAALMVNGDAAQLERLLNVLLENALEASGTHGKVQVEVECEALTSPPRVLTRVVDSGPGPSAAMVGSLFEPFATDKPGGVGLGLFVARSIAVSHGGTIQLVRDNGATEFVVSLPVSTAKPDNSELATAVAARSTPAQQMVAEKWSVAP